MSSNQQQQGGSGSAENQGRSREEQKTPGTIQTEAERTDIADQAGLDTDQIADVQDTGALSGRDDAAGGSGDRMEDTSSNEANDRL